MNKNNPKIEKFVIELNKLIALAVDEYGDKIGVIDSTSTYENPCEYYPIEYKNGQLKISYKDLHDLKGIIQQDVILPRNMEYDGIPQLRDIAKQYKAALKKAGILKVYNL